jgi:MarR-like DNA-binding transcriptional regulator SgrR of sgrS sRNA
VILCALPVVARTRPQYGGTLRVEVEGDPWQRPGGLARRLVLDGLTSHSTQGAAQPALALEWKSENDNHRWQFRLRPGVHFHDGTPMSSSNVVASLEAVCGADCPWTSVRAVGSSVVFLSEVPLPTLPELLAADQYRIALLAPAGGAGAPVGTGPFQFSSAADGVLRLAANDTCWSGRPFLDGIELRAHRSIRDQWLDLTVGRADLVDVPAEQLRQAHDQHLNVVASPNVSLLALTVSDSGVLSSPHLRAAIELAIDRGALSNVIFQKQGEITASLLPADLTGYSFLFSTDRDLKKANELRGGASPSTLTLAADPSPTMQLMAQRIALNLRDAGFIVQLTTPSAPQHIDLNLRRFLLPTTQPQSALDSILRDAGLPMPIPDSTPAAIYKVEREFLDTHLIIPLLYLPRAYAVGGRVRDLFLSADGSPQLANTSVGDLP